MTILSSLGKRMNVFVYPNTAATRTLMTVAIQKNFSTTVYVKYYYTDDMCLYNIDKCHVFYGQKM